MSDWKYYEDVNFSDKNIARYNIDTRDFYCKAQTKFEVSQDVSLIEKLDTSAIDKLSLGHNRPYEWKEDTKHQSYDSHPVADKIGHQK